MIVDAHLDLAYNALRGRDLQRSALEQTPNRDGIPTVGLPDLKAGHIGLICGTLFVAPRASQKEMDGEVYATAAEAYDQATAQLRWYQQQEMAGRLSLVRRAADLPADSDPGSRLRCILLMENADPIASPAQVQWWHRQGIRIVGMAWRQTRYAGGTGAPGGLTPAGRELVRALDDHGILHDVSHLAEQSFWDLLDLTPPGRPVMASHSNCRSLIPTDRQLSDDMIRAIVQRNGVIGINFYDRFLVPRATLARRRASLSDVMDHVKHICDIAGDCDHIGIGTDFDGGLGREQIPHEITTAADLSKLAASASRAGFTAPEIRKLMAGNWLRFFRATVP